MKALVFHGPGQRAWESVPDPTRSLLDEIARERATLVALGTHGHSPGSRNCARRDGNDASPRGSLSGANRTHATTRRAVSFLARCRAGRLDAVPEGSGGSLRPRQPARRPAAADRCDGWKAVHIEGLRNVGHVEWDERKPLDACWRPRRSATSSSWAVADYTASPPSAASASGLRIARPAPCWSSANRRPRSSRAHSDGRRRAPASRRGSGDARRTCAGAARQPLPRAPEHGR